MSRWLIWLLWPAIAAGAQQQVVAGPDASVTAALQNLSQRAATVFVGQVVGIRRDAGVVEIQFRVDTPLVGQTAGSYTLREWAGMWPMGVMRYRVGEHALVFLHGTSSAGLSSVVDGSEGMVPVVADAKGTLLLDVRRLSTRVQRQIGEPLADVSDGAIALRDVLPIVQSRGTAPRRPVRRPLPPGTTPILSNGQVGTRIPARPIVEQVPDAQ
ncbi:MAG TPA: hypothetical protein VFA99_09720 [Acidobacteriaceae bacterium]|nr:hypothetical protein [Acidobacteriaceae bacterium]